MSSEQLSIPSAGVQAIVDETRFYGHRNLETGGFLLTMLNSNVVTLIAVAGVSGIVRRWNLFQISERALDRLFTYADGEGLWIPVQFHSHRFGFDMSPTDEEHGLRVEGFISTILPRFGQPPEDIIAWGWSTFRRGDWQSCAPLVELPNGSVRTLVFDEDGIRER